MRVLQVYKDYYPVVGGIEHHIQLLAEGLREQGVDARVLVTNTDRRTVEGEINGVPVTKTGRQVNVSSAPISLGFCGQLARLSRDADIVHLHFPYPPAEIGQLLVGRGKHFVLTYHSDIVRQKVLGFFYRPFLWQVLRRAERITVSNPQYIQTSRFLQPFADKCVVIHHGVDLTRFTPTPQIQQRAATIRQQYGDVPLILAVGKLRHYKGIDVLIDALKTVEAHALIVGTGPMGPVWQQKARDDGLAERVTFLGEVPEADLIALYHAADIFAFPSTNRAETWGTAQVEAMACGLPVICTELGTGTSYVNQHNVTGLVIPPNDPAALAAALQQLIADPVLRARLGEGGRQRAYGELSKEAMIRQIMAFYQDVIAGGI
ncbi:MAG TPA: glycosyltransferase [Anaerolineae bacterium]|nr:glycosyltransferase [Anaerolineae bacterium]HQI85461.1 glycosyltransferase [Anaerolineae bacterium]